MEVTCTKCGSLSHIPDANVPIGRSYMICPNCRTRINIFKGFSVGATIQNLAGVRFFADENQFHEEYCEAGRMWRVVDVVQPCPDKGRGRACELENRGRCPNQRLILRLSGCRTLFKTCLYRGGRRIFDKLQRSPVGQRRLSSGCDETAGAEAPRRKQGADRPDEPPEYQ